jgi:cytochrome c553
MRSIRFQLLAALAAALGLTSLPGHAQMQPTADVQNARAMAIGVCSICHGPHGNSVNPMFPRLAGQHAWYLKQQLISFRDQTRGDPYAIAYMWGMASGLSDPTIDALAEYFSKQKAGPGKPHPAAILAEGKTIYEHGIPSQGVPACALCHGPQALGDSMHPRLAGQHAEYILKQLASFKNNMRNVAVMHGVAGTLHDGQMTAVADYLESLP